MIFLYSMEDNNAKGAEQANPFPFNNLFLIKGLVTGKNDFWRYLFGIVAAFLGYLSFQLIMMIPLLSSALSNGVTMAEITRNPNLLFNPEVVGVNKSLLLALMMGMFVFTLLFLWLAIRFVQQKSLRSIITGFERIRWSRYFFSFFLWGTLIVLLTVGTYLVSPQDIELRFNAGPFFTLVFVALIFIPIQTATEELIFRGYLMQGLALLFKNGIIPLIITSILFGLMHASNPEAKAHGLMIMMPYYIFFGAFLAVLTLLDEGSELALGIHCANNLFSSLLVTSKNSVLQTDAIFYTAVENPGSEFIVWTILAALCFFILQKKYKLTNWKLLIR
ncbi:MAG: family intrarane metalloprotease protein [Bacteroidota bacterium]|nr:family intrarane metalloprotease protein [Bacteroidota bacterium]